MNTEQSLGCSNRCRDIVIFKLLGCRPSIDWICKILHFWRSGRQEVRNASSCQIASKSVESRPRYGDFSIFQDGGRRHLGFLKFEIFNGLDAQEGSTAPSYQITSKSRKPRLRYDYFQIFKMAAAAILDLQNFKFLTIGTVKRFVMHHRAKLRQNRFNRDRDMAIFQFFKMAAAAILDFWNFKFLTVGTVKRVEVHPLPNFVKIAQTAAEI